MLVGLYIGLLLCPAVITMYLRFVTSFAQCSGHVMTVGPKIIHLSFHQHEKHYLIILLYCRLVLQEVTALSLVVEEAVAALAVAVAAVETSRPHALAL